MIFLIMGEKSYKPFTNLGLPSGLSEAGINERNTQLLKGGLIAGIIGVLTLAAAIEIEADAPIQEYLLAKGPYRLEAQSGERRLQYVYVESNNGQPIPAYAVVKSVIGGTRLKPIGTINPYKDNTPDFDILIAGRKIEGQPDEKFYLTSRRNVLAPSFHLNGKEVTYMLDGVERPTFFSPEVIVFNEKDMRVLNRQEVQKTRQYNPAFQK